jgi:hypothetical protein
MVQRCESRALRRSDKHSHDIDANRESCEQLEWQNHHSGSEAWRTQLSSLGQNLRSSQLLYLHGDLQQVSDHDRLLFLIEPDAEDGLFQYPAEIKVLYRWL